MRGCEAGAGVARWTGGAGCSQRCLFALARSYTRRNRQDVGNPTWESEGTFGNARDKCAAFAIKNKQIKAAIERDQGTFNLERDQGA